MVKVKICGITNQEDALFCERAGANALGFIFFERSKRYIEPGDARDIIRRLSPLTVKAGVFVNHTEDEIMRISALTGITAIQLHGDEVEGFLEDSPLPLIRAYRIKDASDFSKWNYPRRLTPLFDTHSDISYGGTGIPFRHEDIPSELRSRSIIAGGISAENIEGVLKLKPMGVDLVSSLESTPGKKDFLKVQQFFTKLYQYQVQQ